MTNSLPGSADRCHIRFGRLKTVVFWLSLPFSILWLTLTGFQIVKAQDLENDSTVSATVGMPAATSTPTPAPGATLTPSPTAKPYPLWLDTTDYSTNTNDLDNTGSVAPATTTPFNSSSISANFSGNNYLSLPDSRQTDLDDLIQFTLELWVNFSSLPSSGNSMTLVSKDGPAATDRSYNISLQNIHGEYQIMVEVYSSGSDSYQITYPWPIRTSTWYHLAISCDLSKDNQKCSFYINGLPVTDNYSETTTGSGAGFVQDSNSYFRLGRARSDQYFAGKLDDVRIWKDIRTAEEIYSFYNLELGGTEDNLAAYWPFEAVTPVSTPAGLFKIYGYAPSQSQVFLTGIAVSETAWAQTSGYFEFTRLFFPTILSAVSGYRYPELCLLAQDSSRRITSPVCIPALPLSSQTTEVGPILLSPTLVIGRGFFNQGSQVRAEGQTVPQTTVNIHLAREKSGSSIWQLVKEASAYTIPLYQITSNSMGKFEFNLPNDSDTWRVFAGAEVLGSATAKSNTLTFNVRSAYYGLLIRIIEFIRRLCFFIRPYWWLLLVLIQIVIIILLIRYLGRKRKTHKKPVRRVSKPANYSNIVTEYKKLLEKKRP